LSRGEFSYSSRFVPCLGNWWEYEVCRNITSEEDADNERLQDLKTVAMSMGFTPREINRLIASGYTLDEIEDLIYAGDYDICTR